MLFYSIQVEIQFGDNTVDESQFNEKILYETNFVSLKS